MTRLFLEKLTIARALATLTFCGFVGGVIFAGSLMWSTFADYRAAEQDARIVALTSRIGAVVHEVQKERGATSAYLASGGKDFATRLADQRRTTDAAMAALDSAMNETGSVGGELAATLAQAEDALGDLGQLRRDVNSVAIERLAAVGALTDLNRALIDVVSRSAHEITLAGPARAVTSHSILLAAKDLAGLERATGAAGFTVAQQGGALPQPILARLNELVALQEAHFQTFASTATADLAEALAAVEAGQAARRLAELRDIANSGDATAVSAIGGADYFDAATAFIDQVKTLEDRSTETVTAVMHTAASAAETRLVVYAALLVLITVVMGGFAGIVGTAAAGEVNATTSRLDSLAAGDVDSPIPANALADLARISSALETFRAQAKALAATRAHQDELVERAEERIGRVVDDIRRDDFGSRLDLEGLDGPAMILGRGVNAILESADDVVRTQRARDEAALKAEREEARAHAAATAELAEMVDACTRGDFSRRVSVADKTGVFRDLCEGVNQIADAAATGLEQVRASLAALAEGDLSVRMAGEMQGAYAEIQTALERTLVQLSKVIAEIEGQVELSTGTADELKAAMNDLAARTEHQAATVEESAAATEQLSSTVRANAGRMTSARDLTQKLTGYATSGKQISDEAVTAMAKVEGASDKMTDIVAVIDDIAFQTNLLALNASVEAARAGDAGKGFSVVAAEVRSLAGRCADSAKEIGELIKAAIDDVRISSGKVREGGDALHRIESSVAEVAALVADVSTASEEQAGGVAELGQAMAQIDQVTQQNASLVQQTAEQTERLADGGARLAELISIFRRDERKASPAPRLIAAE